MVKINSCGRETLFLAAIEISPEQTEKAENYFSFLTPEQVNRIIPQSIYR